MFGTNEMGGVDKYHSTRFMQARVEHAESSIQYELSNTVTRLSYLGGASED